MSRQASMSSLKTAATSPSSDPSAASYPRESHRQGLGQHRLRLTLGRLLELRYRVYGGWHILASSFRSFRGHISLQSPKEIWGPNLGKAFVPGQPLQRNPRTLARTLYIEMLRASMPWIDIADLRMFLMGFDAGEQWSCHIYTGKATNSQMEDSWLNLASEKFGDRKSVV